MRLAPAKALWALLMLGAAICLTAQTPFSTVGMATIAVHPTPTGSPISANLLGMGVTNRLDFTTPTLYTPFITTGITMSRFMGGTVQDYYDWSTNTMGPGQCTSPNGTPNPNANFANYMADVVANLAPPQTSDIEVNYGTNHACTGGGDPTVAADWVANATTTVGYPPVFYWTVGGEQYYENNFGSIDLHSPPPAQCPGGAACYVAYEPTFYTDMHAAAAYPIKVCVMGNPSNQGPQGANWDTIVLAGASFDCVQVHLYAQPAGSESDSYLLNSAPAQFTTWINTEKTRLATAGKAGTPIFVGETNSVSSNSGKQTESIINALFAGMEIGEAANDGVAAMTWHQAYGNCSTATIGSGNFSTALYGFQSYGNNGAFSYNNSACSGNGQPAQGTVQATGYAYMVASHFIRDGEHALTYTASGDASVKVYASTYNGGYAFMLFNLDGGQWAAATVSIDGKSSGTVNRIVTYDKEIYERSQINTWDGPVTDTTSRPWSGSFVVALPPWSMVVVNT